ncbi:transposase family protein [Streptomyces phyllanthi]|uniref:Transposase family protein n=2 Tax=Streptomyces phyllanthi TaxID=1803180 RepID=A0A5N8VWB1_9ACTN|nr:transposase family protein [Streptomyces phyllanthi]
MQVNTLEALLFSGVQLRVGRLAFVDGNLMIDAAACGPPGRCPQCDHLGVRVHSRYWRHIADLPLGGQKMAVRLRVRRFFSAIRASADVGHSWSRWRA